MMFWGIDWLKRKHQEDIGQMKIKKSDGNYLSSLLFFIMLTPNSIPQEKSFFFLPVFPS